MSIWSDYIAASFFYNLQNFPETLLCGILLLSILLVSPPILFIGIGALLTQLVTFGIGRGISHLSPTSSVPRFSFDGCSTGFIGQTWYRLFKNEIIFNPAQPSIYMATIGFFAGWGFALQNLYKQEIAKGTMKKQMFVATLVLSILLLFLTFLFRIFTKCDTFLSALLGSFIGLLIGGCGCMALGYMSDRANTNIWGTPLLKPN